MATHFLIGQRISVDKQITPTRRASGEPTPAAWLEGWDNTPDSPPYQASFT